MQDYNTIIGSIQMRLKGCQTRSVMDRYKIGSGTLNLIMSRYHANGIPIEELRMMAPKEVENLFYPQKNLQRKDVPLPDFQYYYDRIHAPGSRMNISFCWLDYKEKNPDGYEKSQFYEYFNRFIAENYGGQKVSMAVNRIPGEKMYIDWVGDQPELLTDTETGEIKKVHIFATTLGVSSLIYAEAFPNEKLPCFIEGCAHAVSFYGAVTKYFVPDNLRTAVTKHTKDELILQSTFADLEDFYETIVLPPPARKPKGKPTVENHVRYLETHLVEKLKEKIYAEATKRYSGEAALEQAISNPEGFICVVEGAIPTAMDGKYGYVGGHTMLDLCKRVLPKAKAVVTMGTCAAYGGVQAAKPNPTGSVGVNDCFAKLGMDVKAINIPGCPPNPLNLVGTLVAFLQNKEIKLDDLGRPLMFYGQSVHDLCERRVHFDAGEFAPSFDSEEARKGWCLYDLGCKGPSTYNNCPKALFNETNWPVRAGHPCIGCSEPNFWDDLSPFYQN